MAHLNWLEYPSGATPLNPNETLGLLPKHISTQQQLNEWELANILEAQEKIWRKIPDVETLLSLEYLKTLHHGMFSKTWKWAGQLRSSNKNIGIDWQKISTQTKILVDDIKYQITNKTYHDDEIAARFHHCLVAIHLFPNGNGRHARLAADTLLQSLGRERFSWGNANLNQNTSIRETYIKALRHADQHDYDSLLKFVRT